MISRRRLAILLSVSASAVLISASVSSSGRASTSVPCARSGEPSLDQIQSWVREYYPGFVRRTKSAGAVAVGFVLNDHCNVLRHGAAFLPDTTWSEDLIMTVFPDIHRRGERAGIADGVPPQMKDGKREQYLEAAFIVLRR